MTIERMKDIIYKEVSDKTLSFGCWVRTDKRKLRLSSRTFKDPINDMDYFLEDWEKIYIEEIVWHPVMIWDIIDYMNYNELGLEKIGEDLTDVVGDITEKYSRIGLAKYTHIRLAIEFQSEECVEHIYKIIKELCQIKKHYKSHLK